MKQLALKIIACLLMSVSTAHADKITIAAAADLKYAMEEIVAGFRKNRPGDDVLVVYGSSGKFSTQIRQDAPYDLYFSADIRYPRELAQEGLAGSDVIPYATGRIVLWSSNFDAATMSLARLADPKIDRIAIANPKHAPYGKRAEEALRGSGMWERVQSKLVFGENISQTAQYVLSGNAQVGIIALSLALNPELSNRGGYFLIPDNLHKPLEQGFIITRRGAANPLAKRFADHMGSKQVRSVLAKYGFGLPEGKAGR